MIKVGKQRFVEQFVTHPPVEAFDERIFAGLARAGIVPLDPGFPAPFENHVRGQLGAIVIDNHAGLAANGNQIDEFAHNPLTRDRRIGRRHQAVPRHVIDDVEHPEPAARRHLVMNKTKASALVG
jgi:hypothetical protein